jgi:hypothetical protein
MASSGHVEASSRMSALSAEAISSMMTLRPLKQWIADLLATRVSQLNPSLPRIWIT